MIYINSWYHSVQSAKKFGGSPEEHYPIHRFLDSSKSVIGDVRHRSLYHHTFGIFLCERIFGTTITVGGPLSGSGKLMIPDELDLPAERTEEEEQAETDEFVVRLTEAMSRPLLTVDRNIPEIRRGPQPPVYHPRKVPVRLIAELHIMQDLGWIPSPKDWIDCMELKQWHGGPVRKEREFSEVFGPKKEIPKDLASDDSRFVYSPFKKNVPEEPLGFCDNDPTPHKKLVAGEQCSDLCQNWRGLGMKDHINMDGYEPSTPPTCPHGHQIADDCRICDPTESFDSPLPFKPGGFRPVRQPEPYDDVPSPHTQVKGGFISRQPTEAYYDRPVRRDPEFSCPNCGKGFYNQTIMKLHATQECGKDE